MNYSIGLLSKKTNFEENWKNLESSLKALKSSEINSLEKNVNKA
jgi:hypothetical protein